ncbi:carbohydrate ABC transporter permease [Metabacillus arenae]|uniref:Carbohydrate ABC transporter permease n=1 Tax=Metabacillus arenae TaxID=2771434 RepID=A0A926NPX0_9BACI|nr:carbohydrate ABC transporter permease [Metabacillus arenae]MBD1381897.1 carbohydrate ABC transporter permease [Metabacillus arenae]
MNIVRRNLLPVSVSFLFLIPIFWMLFVSIKIEGTAIDSVKDWVLPPYSMDAYKSILTGSPILTWMFNSFFVAAVTTLLTLIVTSLAAFVFARMSFPYKNSIYYMILAGLMIPGEATIIPLYQVAKDIGILDSYLGLILPSIAGPLGVIILRSFFEQVPDEIIESAKMDGCGTLRIYWNIILPLAKPALAAIGIFTFIGSWNNFLWPFLAVTSEYLYTLPIGIPTLISNYSVDYVRPMVINSISSIPAIIAFLIFQKQIIRGISFTGMKG